MDLRRQLPGIIGLIIGFAVYPLAGRLPAPWDNLAIGGVFAGLGVAAYFYARGERWIQVLGGALLLYGLLRMTVLH